MLKLRLTQIVFVSFGPSGELSHQALFSISRNFRDENTELTINCAHFCVSCHENKLIRFDIREINCYWQRIRHIFKSTGMLKEADDRKEMRRKDEKQKIKTTGIWSFLNSSVFRQCYCSIINQRKITYLKLFFLYGNEFSVRFS